MGDKVIADKKDDGHISLGPIAFDVSRGKIVSGIERIIGAGLKAGDKKIISLVDDRYDSMIKTSTIKPADQAALEAEKGQVDQAIKLSTEALDKLLLDLMNGETLDKKIRGLKVDKASTYDLSSPQSSMAPGPNFKFDYKLTTLTAKFDLPYLAKSLDKTFDLEKTVTNLDWKPSVSLKFTDGNWSFEATGAGDWEIIGPNKFTFGYDFEFWIKLHF